MATSIGPTQPAEVEQFQPPQQEPIGIEPTGQAIAGKSSTLQQVVDTGPNRQQEFGSTGDTPGRQAVQARWERGQPRQAG